MLNLPLPDRAGRGALEQRIIEIVRAMNKVSHGRDPHEFERLSRLLDKTRAEFHKLYGVREHADPTKSALPQAELAPKPW